LIDADNKLTTGFDNSQYEGNPTGVEDPIGADFLCAGWSQKWRR